MKKDQLLKTVEKMVKQGYGARKIAAKLKIPHGTVGYYIKKLRDEDPSLPKAPAGRGGIDTQPLALYVTSPKKTLLEEVERMVREGAGRVIIGRELGISSQKATRLISEVRKSKPDLPKSTSSPFKKGGKGKLEAPRNNTRKPIKKSELKKKGTVEEQIEHLTEKGYGSKKISQALGIAENTADSAIRRIASTPGRITKLEKLRQALEEEQNPYFLAKELCTTPQGLNMLIEKNMGIYNPAGKWIKSAFASRGVRLSYLQRYFKFKDIDQAKAAIQDNFPDSEILETEVDGDILLTPVRDSRKETEWLNIDVSARQFKYSVANTENYMLVRFDEALPGSQIVIYNITDIHVGAKAFRSTLLKAIIEDIAADPMAFVVIGGDLIEAITKSSVGDPNEQYEGINEQVVEAIKFFAPIAHKIIAIEWGNHCGGRTEKAAQFDLARTMASILKVPYFRVRVTIDLRFRGVNKRISLAHRYGRAIKMPQVIAEVKKTNSTLSYIIHCWFSGHTHGSHVSDFYVQDIVPGIGIKQERCFIANGGSFVGHTGTYAEREGYACEPQDLVYFQFDDEGNHSAGGVPILPI